MSRDRTGEYQRHKARCLQLNICFKCRNPKETSKWLCNACLEKTKIIDARRLAKKRSKGLCKCGSILTNDEKLCKICLEKGREYQKRQRKLHIDNGGCITCGKPPMPGTITCIKCSERATNATMRRYKSRKLNKICPFCGSQLSDKFRCNICHNNHLIRTRLYWYRSRILVLKHYGYKCACCGESTFAFLDIDHVHGDGHEHRKIVKRRIIEWAIRNNYPKDLQILCSNCNQAKARFGICPHNQTDTNIRSMRSQRVIEKRQKAITQYGGKCTCCGEDNWAFLEFDHVDNDGKEHRKYLKSIKVSILEWIVQNNYPDSIQLLCSNCNKAKGLYGHCPHTMASQS